MTGVMVDITAKNIPICKDEKVLGFVWCTRHINRKIPTGVCRFY